MKDKIVKTALDMGFSQIGNGVLEGTINNIKDEIRLLKEIVQTAKKNPFFRQLAVQIVNHFPCQHKNWDCYVYAIAKFVRDNIKYIKDITGYETIQTPDNTLKIGGGDCDDHAVLNATLLEAIGMKSAFKVVGRNGSYKHIYVVATTPDGKKWVVDTTEPDFFYPLEEDETYPLELYEDLSGLEELGWGIRIKFKPKKFFKRATGGLRHPKKLIKQIKKKPLNFVNKRVREAIPKPIKASERAFSPVIKPVKKIGHKIEHLSPVKIHFSKFIKRATASKSIDEAAVKAAAAAAGAKLLTPKLASFASSHIPQVSNTALTFGKDIGRSFLLNYIPAGKIPDQSGQTISKIPTSYLPQIQMQSPSQQKTQTVWYKNPMVIAASILTLGLILRR
jgi:hypothetical protein